jgi:hypothetical protein
MVFYENGAGCRITRRYAPRPYGVAGAKPPALNLAGGQVVEPGLFYVAGSTDKQPGAGLQSVADFVKWCRLQDSNPRPTVYKTVALPLC